MGFIVPKPPMPLRRFANIMRGRSRNPNMQNIPRTTDTSTSTTSTFHPPTMREDVCRMTPEHNNCLSFSTRDAVQAIRAMGQAGVAAGRAARQFQEAIQNLGRPSMSEYQMGRVDRLLITMPDGNEITVENPVVEIYIEQETLEHFTSYGVRDRSVVVNEEIRARVGVREDQFFEAIRLIRED